MRSRGDAGASTAPAAPLALALAAAAAAPRAALRRGGGAARRDSAGSSRACSVCIPVEPRAASPQLGNQHQHSKQATRRSVCPPSPRSSCLGLTLRRGVGAPRSHPGRDAAPMRPPIARHARLPFFARGPHGPVRPFPRRPTVSAHERLAFWCCGVERVRNFGTTSGG